MQASASWPVVFGALIGLATTIIVQGFTHGFQTRRERQAREALRDAEREDRRSAFQRETLLAAQDAVEDLGRATAHDHERRREKDNWMERHVPWSDDFRDAAAKLTKLAARTFDDELRELLRQIRHEATLVVTARSYKDSAEAYGRVNLLAGDFNHAAAPILRALF